MKYGENTEMGGVCGGDDSRVMSLKNACSCFADMTENKLRVEGPIEYALE